MNGETKTQLLVKCRTARAGGMDFPTLWHEVLKPSSIVIGPPVQTMRDGRTRLEIRLISGGHIAFDSASNEFLPD